MTPAFYKVLEGEVYVTVWTYDANLDAERSSRFVGALERFVKHRRRGNYLFCGVVIRFEGVERKLQREEWTYSLDVVD